MTRLTREAKSSVLSPLFKASSENKASYGMSMSCPKQSRVCDVRAILSKSNQSKVGRNKDKTIECSHFFCFCKTFNHPVRRGTKSTQMFFLQMLSCMAEILQWSAGVIPSATSSSTMSLRFLPRRDTRTECHSLSLTFCPA